MSAQITLNWEKDLTFETLLDGHKVTIDRDMENGGNDEGPRPKALMLVALARMLSSTTFLMKLDLSNFSS